jgi:hypothetical protein
MTAAFATAALIDAGLITEDDSSKVLDHKKVQREKKQLMEKLRLRADQRYREGDIKCILFDGHKNWTNVMEKDEGSSIKVGLKWSSSQSPVSLGENTCSTSTHLRPLKV